MKRIIAAISVFILAISFTACGSGNNKDTDKSLLKTGDNMLLLEFLKENISVNNTVDEIIDIFKEMCKTPVEEDELLFEYGVYSFTGEDLFYVDLVRQYPDGEDEYYQLRVSLQFAPDEENRQLEDFFWGDAEGGEFFDDIRNSPAYEYAKNHKFKNIDIRIDQT